MIAHQSAETGSFRVTDCEVYHKQKMPRFPLTLQKKELSISSKAAESDRFRITDCAVCQQQKLPRYPKNGNSPRARRNGELIHADIAGPFTPSLNGYDHFLAMIDDFSNVCGIVPMVGRKPALEALQDFVVKVERQLGERGCFIRTDNHTEFVKGEGTMVPQVQ
jgi:hypothetical protein